MMWMEEQHQHGAAVRKKAILVRKEPRLGLGYINEGIRVEDLKGIWLARLGRKHEAAARLGIWSA